MRHELKLLTADRGLVLALLLLGLAALYAVGVGSAHRAALEREFRRAQQLDKANFESLLQRADELAAHPRQISLVFTDPRNAGAVGRYQLLRYAILPPASLAALAVGQSDLFPGFVRISTESMHSNLAQRQLESPRRLLNGRLDLTFVMIFLLPLVAIALSYNLISAERESGTLRLLGSLPVDVPALMLRRIAFRGGVLCTGLLGLTALAAALTRQAGLPLALWAAVMIAYTLFWFALALWVNSFGRGSAFNASALVFAWLLFLMVNPTGINQASAVLFPSPSRVDFLQRSRQASARMGAERSRLMAAYFEDHPDLAATAAQKDTYYRRRVILDESLERELAPLEDAFRASLESQVRLESSLRFLSPAVTARFAAEDLAGTGSSRYADFQRQVEQFHGAYRAFFRPYTFTTGTFKDHRQIPAFHYREPALAWMPVFLSLAALLLPTLGLGAVALARLRRSLSYF